VLAVTIAVGNVQLIQGHFGYDKGLKGDTGPRIKLVLKLNPVEPVSANRRQSRREEGKKGMISETKHIVKKIQ
jgi:hypothetical protein